MASGWPAFCLPWNDHGSFLGDKSTRAPGAQFPATCNIFFDFPFS